MAVPKKKKSKSKTRSRRAAAWKISAPSKSVCPKCAAAKLPHRVCPSCGWYGSLDGGRQAIELD